MTVTYPKRRVFIHEVAPRDGLQIEPCWIETADKIALIDAISRTNVSKVEVSSFVSPRSVPNLRDAEDVFRRINRNPQIVYAALVPNARGAERALAVSVDEVNFVMSASETHNRANMRMSCDQSLTALREVAAVAGCTTLRKHGTIATAFGCPFEGAVSQERVLRLVDQYLEAGLAGITLADTTGMANPRQVGEVVERFLNLFDVPLTLHFHNTRGMGLANILAAYQCGAVRFDASVGGLGGCPFAPGATGNVCTEDVVHMFEEMKVETGVDLQSLLVVANTVPQLVGHDVPGQVAKAGSCYDLHPRPALV